MQKCKSRRERVRGGAPLAFHGAEAVGRGRGEAFVSWRSQVPSILTFDS